MDGKTILKRHAEMKRRRLGFEGIWREIARYAHPHSDAYHGTGSSTSGGDKRTTFKFDDTAVLALDRFAAAMDSMITPRGQRWHAMAPANRKLAKSGRVRRYCEDVTEALFAARYAPRSGFTESSHEVWLSEGSFGTGCLFVDDDVGRAIRYQSRPINRIWIDLDPWNRVIAVHEERRMTLANIEREFPGKLPDRYRPRLVNQPDQELVVVRAVRPREAPIAGRLDYQGMAIGVWQCLEDGGDVLDEGGYRTMPYMVPSYQKLSGEWYGRSPAMMCLGDIKTLNKLVELMLKGAHYAVTPPLGTSEEGLMLSLNLMPGAVNPGTISPEGRLLVQPFSMGSDPRITIEVIDRLTRAVNAAFLVTLFQVLIDLPKMTATETLIRQEEKGQLLAPATARQQSEYLDPMIEREVDILDMAGQLPDVPQELLDDGGGLAVRYESPVVRMQRAEQGQAILNWFGAAVPLAQIDPTVLDRVDAGDAMAVLADVMGVPSSAVRSNEAIEAMQGERAAAAEAERALAAAGAASAAVKDLAAAGAVQQRARF